MLLFLKASLDQSAHTPCWNSFPGSQQVRFVAEWPGAPCFLNPSSAFMAFGSGTAPLLPSRSRRSPPASGNCSAYYDGRLSFPGQTHKALLSHRGAKGPGKGLSWGK